MKTVHIIALAIGMGLLAIRMGVLYWVGQIGEPLIAIVFFVNRGAMALVAPVGEALVNVAPLPKRAVQIAPRRAGLSEPNNGVDELSLSLTPGRPGRGGMQGLMIAHFSSGKALG